MGAPSKRAKKTRTLSEFDIRALTQRLEALRVNSGAWSWSLAEIQNARDAQMVGHFRLPARLAESFNTDDAMFVAKRNRLAPQRALPVKIKPANQTARALRIADEAEALYGPEGVGVTPETMVTIHRHLADHGVAFGVNTATPRLGGARVDIEMHAWPIEHVRWDPTRRCFVTQIDPQCLLDAEIPLDRLEDGAYGLPRVPMTYTGEVEIHHGDGRWVVFAGEELEPWKAGCVLPGALTWARHAFGLRDMSKGSTSHGNAKVVGSLPEGIAIDSVEGAAFLDLLIAVATGDSPVGIKPAGSTVDYLVNSSAAWQVWSELIKASASSASRIYLGHDGAIGTNGGGPGIDLVALLGVTSDIVEGDLHTIERCLSTGLLEVWAAINSGDSTLAPRRLYEIPDADQAKRREAETAQRTAFYAAVKEERALGFDVTAERIAYLADAHGVVAAALAPATVQADAGAEIFAYEVEGGVYTINELRARKGEGPVPWGDKTVPERRAEIEAKSTAPKALPAPNGAQAPRLPAANGAATPSA